MVSVYLLGGALLGGAVLDGLSADFWCSAGVWCGAGVWRSAEVWRGASASSDLSIGDARCNRVLQQMPLVPLR